MARRGYRKLTPREAASSRMGDCPPERPYGTHILDQGQIERLCCAQPYTGGQGGCSSTMLSGQPAPTPAGLFCPPGFYFHCKKPFDCSCVKGARAWKWWEGRPSPLEPDQAPRPGARLGMRRSTASRLSIQR